MEPTRASVLSSNFVLLFQIIVNQKEPDHPSFYINIRSKGTFSSKKEPIGKVWYIADIHLIHFPNFHFVILTKVYHGLHWFGLVDYGP